MRINRFIAGLLGIISCLLAPHYGGAISAPPEQSLIFATATVDTKVTFDPTRRIYTYSYTLTNPSSNTAKIELFELDISLPSVSLPLPSGGLTIDKGETHGGTRNLVPFKKSMGEPLQNDPKFIPSVPVGTMMPGGGFSTGVSLEAVLYWKPKPYPLPGTRSGPLQVFSPGPPAIRDFIITPVFYPTREAGPEELEELKIHGRALAPTAPPDEFDAIALIETLREYITESQTLNWLTDATLVTTLNGHIDHVADAINTDDIAAAKAALKEFISAIPKPPAGTAACTSECSGLLIFNAQYILDSLPTLSDLVITNLSASSESVVLGKAFTVTAIVRNQGGGSSNPFILHLSLSSDEPVDSNDLPFANLPVSAIEMGQIQTLNTTLTLPVTSPIGSYTLGACADAGEVVAEPDETNNCLTDIPLTVTAPSVPNDDISGATAIISIPFTDTILTQGATTAPDDPIESCISPPSSNTVWYRITAPADGVVRAEAFGTVLSAWVEDLSAELECGDPISFSVSTGQTVFLKVGHDDQTGGTVVLSVRFQK